MRAFPLLLVLTCSTASFSCSGEDAPAAPQVAGVGGSARPALQDAERVAHEFLTAVNAEDEPSVRQHLTLKARDLLGTSDGFTFSGEAATGFSLGEVRTRGTRGDQASVPATINVMDREESFDLLLRVEQGVWRVHGVDVSLGKTSFTMSFEGEDSLADALVEGMATQMTDAFEDAAAEWQQGGSAEEIAAARERYEALSVEGTRADTGWAVDLPAGTYAAGELVRECLEGTGYELVDTGFEEELGQSVQFDTLRTSRARVLEEVSNSLGLYPVYADPDAWSGEPGTVSFARGTRTQPVEFAGPFVVEYDVTEEAPLTKGSVTVTARALGLSPALLAANTEMDQYLNVTAVSGATGEDFRTDGDVQFWGSPTVTASSLVTSVSIDLRGLLRGVETLDIAGAVTLQQPADLSEFRFAGPGTEGDGTWHVECKSWGEQTQFEISGASEQPDEYFEDVGARFAPDDAQGSPLGQLGSSAYSWNATTTADVQLPAIPASMRVKVYRNVGQPFEFRASGIPLQQYSQQPEALEALVFSGAAPVQVAFEGWGDLSNADFPEVHLTFVSAANKDATEMQATFLYLDQGGQQTEEFPHSLSGEFTHEGHAPLVLAGSTAEQKTTAFFMPAGTSAVRVRVDKVTFNDGTTWELE